MRRRHCLWWIPVLIGCVDDPAAKDSTAPRDSTETSGDSGTDLPPTVALVAPTGDLPVRGDVALVAEAGDDVGVVSVRFEVDGEALGEDTTSPYEVTWPSDAAAEGGHELRVVATDSAGQTGEASGTIVVDRTDPVVAFVQPLADARVDGVVAIAVDVSDDRGLADVALSIDGAALTTWTEPPFTVDWDASGAAFGAHTLDVVATDQAGNVGRASLGVSIDRPPTVAVIAPVDGDTVAGAVSVEVLAGDDGTIDRVELSVDGAVVDSATVAPYSWPWDTCGVPKGGHTVAARAVDSGGNEAADAVDVTVDQGLEVELISPAGTLSPTELLEAYVSDDDSIATVTYDLDGAVVTTLSAATGGADACGLTCACVSFASTWDLTSAAEGDHVLTVTVTNTAGDIASAATAVSINHDLDGDGDAGTAWGGGDCDESDPARASTMVEIVADGVDQDCDGVDTCHVDADGDRFGTDAIAPGTSLDCAEPGFAPVGGDCDDADAAVWPGAPEAVADGTDQDCDGADACYTDADGDEYGTAVVIAGSSLDCLSGAGATHATDCDDAAADDHPGADEVVANGDDEDCDGVDACYADVDDDGYGTTEVVDGSSLSCASGAGATVSTDCDDEVARTNPGAAEVCGDGVDNDCDGAESAVCEITVADARYHGDQAYDYAGAALAGAGDVNGDGYDDMLVGAPDAGSIDAGAAYLVVGGPTPSSAPLTSAAVKYSGGWTDLGAGIAVAGVGDIDGDGHDDMLIGARDDTPGTAYLILGSASPSSHSLSSADATFTGDDNAAGYAVGGGGDVDGDGFPDLLIGAFADDDGGADAGAIYLIPGGPGLATAALADVAVKLAGEAAGDWLGFAVADAGDVDGDGFDDILTGGFRASSVAYMAGVAYVIRGGTGLASRPLDDGDAQYDGQQAYDDVGISVAGAGDVNADGYDDMLVGAPGVEDARGDAVGAMYLLLGAAVLESRSMADADAEYLGEDDGDQAGRSVAGPGDVDGDGYADLLTGARDARHAGDTSAGKAYLLFGAAAPVSVALGDADVTWYGATSSSYLAESVGAPGDVNGDGHPDLLVGAEYEDDSGESSVGAAYLILGFAR